VSELESDLRTAMTDLATMSRQLSQTMNQLQVVTEEASRFRAPTPNCRRISRVSRTVPRFSPISVLASCRDLT
jgi:hypothetical protein